ncbi:hypothetical protein AHAS_Ahas05G0262200 [Arachis hypogaea]
MFLAVCPKMADDKPYQISKCLLPCRVTLEVDDEPLVSAPSCDSVCLGSNNEHIPIAMSVVSSVSGMQSDIRRLSEAIRRHDAPPDPASTPIIDTTFTVDHILFFTKRNKKPTRKLFPTRKALRSMHVPEVVDLNSDDDPEKTARHTKSNRGLETSGLARQRGRDAPALEKEGVMNLGRLLSMKVERIPKSMNFFPPNNEMNLSGVKLVVATYIFDKELQESELLIDVGDCIACRGALMTLAPKCEVVDDVLNDVVRMLASASNHHCWFLPMTIMQNAITTSSALHPEPSKDVVDVIQVAVGGRKLTSANMTSICNKYMRCVSAYVVRPALVPDDHRHAAYEIDILRFTLRSARSGCKENGDAASGTLPGDIDVGKVLAIETRRATS